MIVKEIFLDSEALQNIINHPVHIVDDKGNLSPSAFIPFCEFGGSREKCGVNIDQFSIPVCNCFKPKILDDQLCYEVDPNRYIDVTVPGAYFQGITLVIDYNEERKISYFKEKEIVDGPSFTSYLSKLDSNGKVGFHMQTAMCECH